MCPFLLAQEQEQEQEQEDDEGPCTDRRGGTGACMQPWEFLPGVWRGAFTLECGELLALDSVSDHCDGEGAVERRISARHVDDRQHRTPRLRRQ
jgi:hypothetical protein